MNGEWAYFKEYFTPIECDTIIKQALELPERPATLGVSSVKTDDEWRRSSIRSIIKDTTWSWLFSKLDKLVASANREWFNVDYTYLPGIQFATYDSSNLGCYKRHQDVFLAPIPTHRKLSVTVQLSDPDTYEGGDLRFLDIGIHPKYENIRARGTVCVFPSLIFHEVTPVTSGIRHSLAAWYEGPRWR